LAGESAREIAQQRRQKAMRLHKVAEAYERGADGEQRTAAALAMLPASGWLVLHDVRWPGRAFANIDHIVLGPGGIFVNDSKAWTGRVEVRDGVLRQNGRRRDSAVAGAAEAARAVAGVLGMEPTLVRPVLCFVGQAGLPGWAGEVMLTTTDNLVQMLSRARRCWIREPCASHCSDCSGASSRHARRRLSLRPSAFLPGLRGRSGLEAVDTRCASYWGFW
jgi:hypothetical protein